MKIEQILVTGGAGFIGSHVVDKLLKRGRKVICIDNFNDYYDSTLKRNNVIPNLSNENYKLYEGDFTNSNFVKTIFQENKIDKIIHLGARAGVRASINNPLVYNQTNYIGTLILLEMAKEFNIDHFIFASSSSVYGSGNKTPFNEIMRTDTPKSPYAASKKAGEILCYTYHILYNINITCLRFFTVYGPRGRPDMAPMKFLKLIDEETEIPVYGTGGDMKRDYTYVGDIVDGIILASEKVFPFEIINLGNSHPKSLNNLIALLEKFLGKKSRPKFLSIPSTEMNVTYADITKAQRLLGFSPRTNLKEGVEKMVDWYLKK